MTTAQIIKACQSGECTPEHLILESGFSIEALAKYFNLDANKPTHELRYMIVDCINEVINTSHNP